MKLIIDEAKASNYLSKILQQNFQLKSIKQLGAGILGIAYRLELEVEGEKRLLVLKTLSSKGFGQDFSADRANRLIYAHSVYNKLLNHVKSYDVGAILNDGSLTSLSEADEFFLIMDFIDGQSYAEDLERIKERGTSTVLDIERVKILAEYEAKIHSSRIDNPPLYIRRIRDLIGRGDCIMGIIDTYKNCEKTLNFTSVKEFKSI